MMGWIFLIQPLWVELRGFSTHVHLFLYDGLNIAQATKRDE